MEGAAAAAGHPRALVAPGAVRPAGAAALGRAGRRGDPRPAGAPPGAPHSGGPCRRSRPTCTRGRACASPSASARHRSGCRARSASGTRPPPSTPSPTAGAAHAAVVRRTAEEGWYAEELFARFAVLSAGGHGRRPGPARPGPGDVPGQDEPRRRGRRGWCGCRPGGWSAAAGCAAPRPTGRRRVRGPPARAAAAAGALGVALGAVAGLPAPRRPGGAARAVLAEALERAATERVELACGGGRGRTGTALACLAVLDGVPAEEAVAWVRRHYDRRAVETRAAAAVRPRLPLTPGRPHDQPGWS